MGRSCNLQSGIAGPVVIGIVAVVVMAIIGYFTLAAMRDWCPFEPELPPPPAPAPAPEPAPTPTPAPPPPTPKPQPPANKAPDIHDLDFVERKIIGVGDIASVRVTATDVEKEDLAYVWDARRGYIPEEGLTTWKVEVDYWAPDSAGLDAITVNVTDLHLNTSTEVKSFFVYDQKTAKEAQSYLEQGIFLAQINDYGRSVEQLTKLADIVPEFHEAYLLRGQAYTELEAYQQAIDDYRMYIELEPTDVDAYLLRARANLLWGYRDEALLDIETFYSLAESAEPWRLKPLVEPYEDLRTDRERLMWLNDAVSPDVLLPNYLQ